MCIIAVGTETLGKEGLPARRKGHSLKTILTIIILTLRTKFGLVLRDFQLPAPPQYQLLLCDIKCSNVSTSVGLVPAVVNVFIFPFQFGF